jgi:hypothetical protein
MVSCIWRNECTGRQCPNRGMNAQVENLRTRSRENAPENAAAHEA